MTGQSNTMTTCIQTINSNTIYELNLTNASTVYLELLGSQGGKIEYSSTPILGNTDTISGCSS